jgi:Flp pilus assembly protein TadD
MRAARDARVAPVLAELVRDDPSPLVRAAGAESLGVVGGPGAAEALAEATRDPYRLVRIRAVRGLASVPVDQLPDRLREPVATATRELEAAFTVRADDPWALTNLGTWELERGHLDRAETAFRDAVRVRPAHVPAWVNLAMAQARRGDRAGAEASLRRAVAAEPASATANLDLGLLLAETNRPAEADAALRRALAADPSLAQAEYNLCALLAQERLAEAVQHCRRAATLEPRNGKYAYALAFFAWRAGDESTAVSTLESLLREKPSDADPYLLLASIHEKAGRGSKAIELLRRAAVDPAIPGDVRRVIAERAAAARPR